MIYILSWTKHFKKTLSLAEHGEGKHDTPLRMSVGEATLSLHYFFTEETNKAWNFDRKTLYMSLHKSIKT